MTFTKIAITRIRAYVSLSGTSITAFAKKAGVSEASIRDLNKPGWNPGARHLNKLEAAIPGNFFQTFEPNTAELLSYEKSLSQRISTINCKAWEGLQ